MNSSFASCTPSPPAQLPPMSEPMSALTTQNAAQVFIAAEHATAAHIKDLEERCQRACQAEAAAVQRVNPVENLMKQHVDSSNAQVHELECKVANLELANGTLDETLRKAIRLVGEEMRAKHDLDDVLDTKRGILEKATGEVKKRNEEIETEKQRMESEMGFSILPSFALFFPVMGGHLLVSSAGSGREVVDAGGGGGGETPLTVESATTTHENTPARSTVGGPPIGPLARTIYRRHSEADSDMVFEAEDLPLSDQEAFDGLRVSEIKGRRAMLYRPEWFKTILSMIAFFLATSLNHLALAIVMDITSRDPLPDLAHVMYDQTYEMRDMTDNATIVGGVTTCLFIFLFHKHRSIVIRRMLIIGTVVFIMRAITITVTHIPPSYKDSNKICEEPSQDPDYPIIRYFKRSVQIFTTIGLQSMDKKLFCGDMLFSGHTTTAAICCFMLNHYTPKALWPFRIALISICVCAMVGAVLSRAHYTADVVLGYWISSLVFSFYHSFTYVKHRKRALCRPFRRVLIFWIMYEMEKNVPYGRVPNDLDWPLPWPKSIKEGFREWNLKTRTSRAGRVSRFLAKYRLKLHF